MEFLLYKLDRVELFKLMHLVLSRRGLEGKKGTWEQFLNVHDPQFGHMLPCPSFQSPSASITFLTTLDKKEDVQLLMPWLTSPTRALRHHYSNKFQNENVEQRLVRMTLTRYEHPLEYYLSLHNNPEDWLVTVTGIGPNKCKPVFQTETEMISLSCDMVLCEDGSEAPIRVVALDHDFKVILDEFVKPNQPVSDLRTDITGLTSQILDDAIFLYVADLHEMLRPLVSTGTIMAVHGLNKVLADHAMVIDTSLVFTYDYSGSLTIEKPSLNARYKCNLGYDMSSPSNSCLDSAVVAMKLVIAVVEQEILKEARNKVDDKYTFLKKMLDNV